MQEKANPHSERGVQRAVLALALAAHPKSLAIPELAREFAEGEAESAIRDLVGVGLLECSGLTIRPTPAAVHFERLGLS